LHQRRTVIGPSRMWKYDYYDVWHGANDVMYYVMYYGCGNVTY